MKNFFLPFLLLISVFSLAQESKYVLIIHGGAGSMSKETLSKEKETAYQNTLELALKMGYEQIKNGGSSLDAVQEAIIVMENSPLFNAGKGSVFTHEKTNEMDASIMYGPNENAGAVAGVQTIKNPITAARAIMENSPHVLLSREGAEVFAREQGLEIVSPSYFFTADNYQRLLKIIENEKGKVYSNNNSDWKYGTVGAVALDNQGNLSAATSTGGMTNKRWARIGDSPIIGAGTYADQNVGISATGWGEFYIRAVAAYDVAAQIKYGKTSLQTAVKNTLDHIQQLGGNCGMIALDKDGNMTAQFNTKGMFRGTITENGEILIEIYGVD